jgi:hypothetical protein
MSYASKSYVLNAILGTVAIGVTFGAVQIASGEGLSNRLLAAKAKPVASHDVAMTDVVNRGAKSDRAALAAGSSKETRTLSFHVDRLPATSVVVRLPSQEARSGGTPAPAPILTKEQRKPMVACEPVVSVLSEIAKQLQPGRCIT